MYIAAVPSFYLYGEPHQTIADDFVHVEHLADRSRPSEWTIQAHVHAELHHLFLVTAGGGAMDAEADRLDFVAPALLIVPATLAHGFSWANESAGFVLTLAQEHLARLARNDTEITPLFSSARAIGLAQDDLEGINLHMTALMRELSWSAVGHRAAIDASLLAMIVIALRQLEPHLDQPTATPGRQAMLVAQMREHVERHFRTRQPLAAYADSLGVSESTLRAACMQTAGMSPIQIIDQRIMLEARRALMYSNLTIAEIAYAVGFSDPAYFSRFFSKYARLSPRRYRYQQLRSISTVR